MTEAKQKVSFAFASVAVAPFAIVLISFALATAIPALSLFGDIAFVAYFIFSGPIGVAATGIAAIAVCVAFRWRNKSNAVLSALVAYAAVLICYAAYLAWWYATGQKLDTP